MPRGGVVGRGRRGGGVSRGVRGRRLAGAEVELDAVARVGDLVDGEGHDAGELLGVEQDQAAGDPIGEAKIVVVEETVDDGPAPFGVEGNALLARPPGNRKLPRRGRRTLASPPRRSEHPPLHQDGLRGPSWRQVETFNQPIVNPPGADRERSATSARHISGWGIIGYTGHVSKRLVDIDEDLLQEASGILGASTMKETVNRALEAVVVADRRRRLGDYEGALEERGGLDLAPITPAVMATATDLQHELARIGQHRVPIPDLVIAAAAQHAGLVVLHYDADFERIAAVGGPAHEWIVARGSV
jgi:predicted nucleic acid-binding protein